MTKIAESERELMDGLFRALELETDDLRQLAEAAGLDPEWAYADVDMTGADLRGQDLRGMVLYIPDPSKVLMDEKTRLDARTLSFMNVPEISEKERKKFEKIAEMLLCKNKPVPDNIAWKIREVDVSGGWGFHHLLTNSNLFSNLIWIRKLRVSNTPLSSIEFISNMKYLVELDISNTQVSDLSPISSIVSIKSIDISETMIRDLSPVKSLTNLEWIDISRTKISDLSPLKKITKLKYINALFTNVRDWSPVAHVPEVIGRPDNWKETKR